MMPSRTRTAPFSIDTGVWRSCTPVMTVRASTMISLMLLLWG